MARMLAKRLSMTGRQYRLMLTTYRKYMDVVEVKMSSGQLTDQVLDSPVKG